MSEEPPTAEQLLKEAVGYLLHGADQHERRRFYARYRQHLERQGIVVDDGLVPIPYIGTVGETAEVRQAE